jgi:hypothetical protein
LKKLLLARGAAAPNSGSIRFVQRIQLQYLLGADALWAAATAV